MPASAHGTRFMTVGATSLPIRSSPTRRSVLQRAAQLAHVHTPGQQLNSAVDPMFARANKAYEASQPPPRKPLAKQLFPSSSPSGSSPDIREQLKKPSTGLGAASASARTGQSPSIPLGDRPANMTPNMAAASGNRNAAKPSLASLYSNSNSFKTTTNVIDLTGAEDQKQASNAVYFAEDDFSDDENLDLDFEAPSALPVLPLSKQPPAESMPPPPTSTQTEEQVPWSSSPASHFWAPKPQRSTSDMSTQSSRKRQSSGDSESIPEPPPKKPTKRVLPASFKNEQVEEPYPSAMRTPASKPKGFWDPTASAIKEQKRQLKNQTRKAGPQDANLDGMQEAIDQHVAKSVAPLSLSSEQEHVLDLVVNKNASVFFTGPAGTGKSVLMRAIISKLKDKHVRDPERVAVTASTGLAACNIGGMTLHSFSGMSFA